MSNDKYQTKEFFEEYFKEFIKHNRGLEDLINNENISREPYKELTEQDLIDFIKTLENNANKKS